MVRKLGRKFVYDFCNKEQIEKLENSKLMKNTEKIEFIMLILFLIPGTPKDLLVYIGGLLPIKPLRFILISTFARLPSVISSTFAGENIASGDWTFSIIIYFFNLLFPNYAKHQKSTPPSNINNFARGVLINTVPPFVLLHSLLTQAYV